MSITRQSLAQSLKSALGPLNFVNAMWEGGSAAFGRDDEYSDLDLQLDVDDERIGDAFAAVEVALNDVSPIELQYNMPEPAWHGMSQRFYKLRDAAPYLLVDLAIRKASDRDRFNEIELHGEPVIYFDKPGVVVTKHLDWPAHREKLGRRLAELAVLFPLFQGFVQKEILRGNALGAMHFYHGLTLRPLHEAALMLHCPERYNYSPHYAIFELPEKLLRQLTALYYVGSPEELERNQADAAQLFAELMHKLHEHYGVSGAHTTEG
jgi:hypothetical protein